MTPLSFSDLLARFSTAAHPAKRQGHNWRVLCPVHGDTTPSLDIAEGAAGPLFQCRTHHCSADEILAAMELVWADVLPPKTNGRAGAPFVADHVYDYRSRDGALLYRVLRQDRGPDGKKKILQQAADGSWGLKGKGIPQVPYRLPDLTGPVVVVAEGEKAVEALWRAGVEATTNSGGVGMGWKDAHTLALKALGITTLVILPDHDDEGYAHAARIAASAAAHGLSSRQVILPGLPPKGDAYDWLLTNPAAALLALLAPGAQAEPTPGPAPEPPPPAPELQLDPAFLDDAVVVAAEGQKIAANGIPWVVQNLIPAGGMLGMMVARAKVGKTSLGLALAQAVATGEPFIGQATTPVRVLVVAAEDPPAWVAFLARHLTTPAGRVTFYRAPIQLDADGCARIAGTAKAGGYGLVLIASWQAVITSLVKDENDNAGAARVVETVKAVVRKGAIPWLIDAHAGKAEDQKDDADPMLALRGASAAAGAADYLLSLRYADGAFGSKRRLSGKGRFVNFETVTLDYDPSTGTYEPLGDSTTLYAETTWAQIEAMGALTDEWQSAGSIALAAGLIGANGSVSGATKKKLGKLLASRAALGLGVERWTRTVNHKGTDTQVSSYRRAQVLPDDAAPL